MLRIYKRVAAMVRLSEVRQVTEEIEAKLDGEVADG